MSTLDYQSLLMQDGRSADPNKVTEAGRLFHNANLGAESASIVVKTSNGLLFGFTVSSETAQWIQVFDLTALPADTAVPAISISVAAGGDREMQWVPPRYFRQGIVLCNSSTQHTKTIGSADCIFDVQFL